MNCHDSQRLLHAYADGELDLVKSLEIEQHLEDCPACAQERQNLQSLHAAVGHGALYYSAPAALRAQVTASVRSSVKSAPRSTTWSWNWQLASLPLAAAVMLAFFLAPLFTKPSANELLARDVMASHVRSLMAAHITDVASTDQHTVKPWFDGKLDFAPPVKDFVASGFPLSGGRLDYIGGRPVAALIYLRNKHIINLFIWPTTSTRQTSVETDQRQGYNLIHWTNSSMTFWAASDLNETELREFARLWDGN